MTKKKYTIPYQYTIIAHATVYAESLQEAIDNVELLDGVSCPDPEDKLSGVTDNIQGIKFSYLENSFEIHHDDLDLYNNPSDEK